MGEGSSYLTVPIPRAQPEPPDVTVAGTVPGGKVIPCTPLQTSGVVNRTQYRLSFPFRQGVRITIRRIHLKLPMSLEEVVSEKQELVVADFTVYKTEAEAQEAAEGLGGFASETETQRPPSYSESSERVKTKNTIARVGAITKVLRAITTERSILPITMTVIARLIGPDGEMWSDSFDVPMHFTGAVGPGNLPIGTGNIDAYADLQNGLVLDPDQRYSLALLVFVPSSVATSPVLGLELDPAKKPVAGDGEMTLWYDVETGSVGK